MWSLQKKDMVLHYLQTLSVQSVHPRTMAGYCIYILVGFLPITLFYLAIVMFQVSATSGPLNVFVFSAQIIAFAISIVNLA